MPTFSYRATDAGGKLITGSLDAPDKNVAAERLQKENYYPISIEPETRRKYAGLLPDTLFKRKQMSRRDLLNFTQQMHTLLKSGLELDRCLGIMTELVKKEKSRELIVSIQEAVHSGDTLSGAMTKYPDVFGSLYLNMIKAGEEGGFLDTVFERLSYYMEGRLKLLDSVRSALIYPAVLAVAGLSALGVLTAYVIPKFAVIFEDMGGELPAATRFLVWFSEGLMENFLLIVIAAAAIVFALRAYLLSDSGRRRWDALLLKLPLLGTLTQKVVVSQFTRTLGTLLQSGVPIIRSLGIVKESVSNSVFASALERTAQGVKEGKKMSALLSESGLFPPLAVHMMLVGEESGKLGEMMIRMSDTYDEEVETAVKRMITLFEPAMILIMGVAVAFVVISMLTAIFSVNELPF
jgi:general secretion pathway protein F